MECTSGCTLDGAEMVERANAWRDVSSHALSREVHADGIVSVYPSQPELVERLEDLIAAEAECCSFLEFSIREENGHTVVRLAFPEEARALVQTVIGLPVTASSP